MKARFDVKQPPVKIIESDDKAYVFICLNEEEKQEEINYTYVKEPEIVEEPESIEGKETQENQENLENLEIQVDNQEQVDVSEELNDNDSELIGEDDTVDLNEEIEENTNVDIDTDIETETVTVTYYEYDYNEFVDKKENLNLDDIQENPENYLDYSPTNKNNEDGKRSVSEEDFNSLKSQFEELQNAIERGLTL